MAKRIFLVMLAIAAPGIVWQCFEMYGLTLFGPPMLFFSIVHTMPIAVVLVLAAVPNGIA